MRQRHLIIAGQRWRVQWLKHPKVGGANVYGFCDPGECRIGISTLLAVPVQRTTLLHELIHAVHSTGADKHPRDEDACTNALAGGLYAILREQENGWLWDYLREEP